MYTDYNVAKLFNVTFQCFFYENQHDVHVSAKVLFYGIFFCTHFCVYIYLWDALGECLQARTKFLKCCCQRCSIVYLMSSYFCQIHLDDKLCLIIVDLN